MTLIQFLDQDGMCMRVLNKQMDFCYVILETVQFHLHRWQSIPDFQPDQDPQDTLDGGYAVIFTFVRGDGVQRQWEVGLTILYRKKLKFSTAVIICLLYIVSSFPVN